MLKNFVRSCDRMNAKSDETSLLKIFETLDEDRQNSLIDFAEYLQSKGNLVVKEMPRKVDIERPAEETVVGAIKRLKSTYPMIESMSIFSAASSLMTENMVNGRSSVEVIDEMHILFEEHYQSLLKEEE